MIECLISEYFLEICSNHFSFLYSLLNDICKLKKKAILPMIAATSFMVGYLRSEMIRFI